MQSKSTNAAWWHFALAILFAGIAILRVVQSYPRTAGTFDEPYHVGAAIELLDKHTYALDPLHPPLQRIAIGLPLYLAGERYPNLSAGTTSELPEPPACAVGNAVLNDSGRYLQNLTLARLGMIPFLLLGCAVVFFWTREEFGIFSAVMAVALFSTLPIVLEFSSIAYTDMVAASTQVLALWALVRWLDRGNMRSAVWLGLAVGLALAAKMTTYIFVPACGLSLLALKWMVGRTRASREPLPRKNLLRQISLAGVLAIVVLWSSYGFQMGHVRQGMQLSADSIPSFQHFPAPFRRIGRELILSDPIVPAPALLRGIADAWVMEKSRPEGYLFGHSKSGGWWYFFLVGVAVKTPIPVLALSVLATFTFPRFLREGRWTALAPAACVLAVFVATLPVHVNYGVRHVLVLFPLLAILAGEGCSVLWQARTWRAAARFSLAGLLAWQCISTARASGDYIAYFNELAGADPSKILVAGCDLDCGQDLFALSSELRNRGIKKISLALWTSAEIGKLGLPQFEILQPNRPATGWVAISLRALRAGDVFHKTYAPGAFDWLASFQPVAHIGKTILLYHIPESNNAAQN